MAEPFVKKVYVDEAFPDRGDRYALCALIAESVSVYYWCEAFVERKHRPRTFCIIGQRGLAEYAAKKIAQVLHLIEMTAAKRNETIGWQYGSTVSLRTALKERREKENGTPEYQHQMSVSVYRARKELTHAYRIGTSDARATFDSAGFYRGKEYPWDLSKIRSPIQVLERYYNEHRSKKPEA